MHARQRSIMHDETGTAQHLDRPANAANDEVNVGRIKERMRRSSGNLGRGVWV